MGNLLRDTELTAFGHGQFTIELHRDWSIWGPVGGYLAAVAIRAASQVSSMERPASIHIQFHRTATYSESVVTAQAVARGRQAEAVRVEMTQRGRSIFTASLWAIEDNPLAATRHWSQPPPVPRPDELGRIDEMVEAEGGLVQPIWRSTVETRVPDWGGPERPAGDPYQYGWMRLIDDVAITDPWISAARLTFASDTIVFPALGRGFPIRETNFIAPTLDLYVAFHQGICDSEWILVEGRGWSANQGLLGGEATVWSEGGDLVCSSAQQMMVRQSVALPR